MACQIQPWHANIKKRQVKAPKVYVRDTGVLHSLLGLKTESEILRHSSYGSSWEGFVIEEIIHSVEPDDVYLWATHQGAEVDMIFSSRKSCHERDCFLLARPPSVSMRIGERKKNEG